MVVVIFTGANQRVTHPRLDLRVVITERRKAAKFSKRWHTSSRKNGASPRSKPPPLVLADCIQMRGFESAYKLERALQRLLRCRKCSVRLMGEDHCRLLLPNYYDKKAALRRIRFSGLVKQVFLPPQTRPVTSTRNEEGPKPHSLPDDIRELEETLRNLKTE